AGLQYEWDFGDLGSGASNRSIDEHGIHQYTVAGDYTVKLSVTTPEGCTISTIKSIRVNGSTPVAAFEILNTGNLCSNQEIMVKDMSTIASVDRITRLEWYIDGVPITEKHHPALNDTYALN